MPIKGSYKRSPQAIMCQQNGKPRRNGSISKGVNFPRLNQEELKNMKSEKLPVIKFNQYCIKKNTLNKV